MPGEMQRLLQELAAHRFTVYCATAHSVQLHAHDYLELAYVQSGHMEHHINGHVYTLGPGDFFIVDYDTAHAYHRVSQEKLTVQNILFYPEFLDRGLTGVRFFRDMMRSYLLRFAYQTLRDDPTGMTFQDDDGKIRALINDIYTEYAQKNYGYLEYIRCILVELLILIMRKIGQQACLPAKSEVVAKMIKYANEHYAQQLRLSNLSHLLGYSVPHLSQKFSKEIGMGFMDYVHQVRIAHACQLLEITNMTVSEIAEAVGYSGTKYFTEIFKANLSLTPKAFRNLHKSPHSHKLLS